MSEPKEIEPEQRFWAVVAWLRYNLLVIMFTVMLLFQFLTWQAILDLRHYFPASCNSDHPCHVIIDKP